MAKDLKNDFSGIVLLMDELLNDSSIPRNVRANIDSAKKKLECDEEDSVKASHAIYLLDDVSHDINLPIHARTMIWNILSELESLKN